MDEIGVLHPAELASRDDDLAGTLEVRIGLQTHREGDVFEDRGLLVGDPGDPDDIARIEAVVEPSVDSVERPQDDARGREKVSDGPADGARRDLLAAVDEGHGQAPIERHALAWDDRGLPRRREPVPRPSGDPEPAERVGHGLGGGPHVRRETVYRHG